MILSEENWSLKRLGCCVMGSPSWVSVIVDGFGNGMKPQDIRDRMSEYRELERASVDLVIWLVTTNRTALDAMEDDYHSIFLPDDEGNLHPLDQVFNPDWMAHFSLGDLYDRGEFNPPWPQSNMSDSGLNLNP